MIASSGSLGGRLMIQLILRDRTLGAFFPLSSDLLSWLSEFSGFLIVPASVTFFPSDWTTDSIPSSIGLVLLVHVAAVFLTAVFLLTFSSPEGTTLAFFLFFFRLTNC